MATCENCGASLPDLESPKDPLWPLQEAGRIMQGLPETTTLCEKCRERQLLLGTAALFAKSPFGG